jgi:hypothetical protein
VHSAGGGYVGKLDEAGDALGPAHHLELLEAGLVAAAGAAGVSGWWSMGPTKNQAGP